eukprot:2668776-Alexandrium_andersonii.AAC.1
MTTNAGRSDCTDTPSQLPQVPLRGMPAAKPAKSARVGQPTCADPPRQWHTQSMLHGGTSGCMGCGDFDRRAVLLWLRARAGSASRFRA